MLNTLTKIRYKSFVCVFARKRTISKNTSSDLMYLKAVITELPDMCDQTCPNVVKIIIK